jgi:phospholipid transport system substrate-binding protein
MMRSWAYVLAVWLLFVAPARAATPLDYTRSILDQVHAVVAGNQTQDEKLAALSALLGKFLDTDSMGREALGQHWSSFTPPQQKEFLALFRKLFQQTYVQTLLLFQNPDFIYAGEQSSGSGATVDTKIVTPRDQFDVSYQLIPAGDKWRAVAITVENVNLTTNLSNQFNRLLDRMSVDDLLALMRRKYGTPNGEA